MLVAASPAMHAVVSALTRLAPHARTTLISGETGTGKSTIARAMHRLGPQRGGPFLVVSGAAASDLAGTSATVFIPDVADLSFEAQAALTRAIADAAEAPAGVGLHVIAATDCDLRSAVTAGRFRAELYYRLTTFELHLPPLRARREDVPALAATILRSACARLGLPPKQLTPGAARLLQDLPWPGNVRELRNVVERAGVLWEGDVLAEPAVRAALALGVPAIGAEPAVVSYPQGAANGPSAIAETPSWPPARLDDAQHRHVRAALVAAKGNKTIAAAHLGVSRRALYRLIDRYERRVPPAATDERAD
ncbi:MAG: sigma 54-interacting transcriptional regulator [Acidobacteriota bacterium]